MEGPGCPLTRVGPAPQVQVGKYKVAGSICLEVDKKKMNKLLQIGRRKGKRVLTEGNTWTADGQGGREAALSSTKATFDKNTVTTVR